MTMYTRQPEDGNVTEDGHITWDKDDDLYFVWADNNFRNCLLVTSDFIEAIEEYKISCT